MQEVYQALHGAGITYRCSPVGNRRKYFLFQSSCPLREPRMVFDGRKAIRRTACDFSNGQFCVSVQPLSDLGVAVGISQSAATTVNRTWHIAPRGVQAGIHLEETIID